MPDDPAWRRAFSKVRQRLAGMVPRDKPAPIGSSRLETLPNELKHEIIAAGLTGDPNEDSRYLSKVKRLNSHFSNFVAPEETTKGTEGKLPHFSPVAKYNRVLNEPGQLARDLYREVIPNDRRFIHRVLSPEQRITAVGPILKFQPPEVRSRLVGDILAHSLTGDRNTIAALTAIGPHLDAFNDKDRSSLVDGAVRLAKQYEGNDATWDAITAMGRHLEQTHKSELAPLMERRPELRQRLDDSIRNTNETSAMAGGDVSRQNQNNKDIKMLRRDFEMVRDVDTDNRPRQIERYGNIARDISTTYEFARKELMKSTREMPNDPRRDLMNTEPSGRSL